LFPAAIFFWSIQIYCRQRSPFCEVPDCLTTHRQQSGTVREDIKLGICGRPSASSLARSTKRLFGGVLFGTPYSIVICRLSHDGKDEIPL